MTDKELNDAIKIITDRLEGINHKYIIGIAKQIQHIGELNPKSLNQITEMVRMNANIFQIVSELDAITALNEETVQQIFQRVIVDTYLDSRFVDYYEAQTGLHRDEITLDIAKGFIPATAQERIERYTLAIAAQTNDRLENLSNTTAIYAPYKAAIDQAVYAVSEGVTSYTEATRRTVKSVGTAGMQVYYASGYHRRLDTAVRQNIIDATTQLAQTTSIMIGEALGYDAMEISAHEMSAPDHEPVQGHVFMLQEWYKLQQDKSATDIDGKQHPAMRRPIAEWNCGHFAYPFSTEYSKRKWTNEQLDEMKKRNKEGCKIGEKHYTMYEVSQLMRDIETQVRREKDAAIAAQAAGNEELRKECQVNINRLGNLYKKVTDASGLTPRKSRMVVDGFRKVSWKDKEEQIND